MNRSDRLASAKEPFRAGERQPLTAEEKARAVALEIEALQVFGNKDDAARWYYNLQLGLPGQSSPYNLAAVSDAELARVLDYLHSLSITPRPAPNPWKGKGRARVFK